MNVHPLNAAESIHPAGLNNMTLIDAEGHSPHIESAVATLNGRTAHLAPKNFNGVSTDLYLTLFEAQNPARLSKSFRLQAGILHKESGGILIKGTATCTELNNIAEFAELLRRLTPCQALSYGISQHQRAEVRTQSDVTAMRSRGKSINAGGIPVIARDREHFSFAEGPGIWMLDYDPPAGSEPLSREALLAFIFEACPALKTAPYVWRPSAGSCIFNTKTGETLRGICGQRIYFFVESAKDIPRAGEVLFNRLWLCGYGRFDVSKSGALLNRTPLDRAVWQAERLDFCGGAVCELPLAQYLPEPMIFNADAPPIDTLATLPELTPSEIQQVEALQKAAKGAMDGAAEEAKTAWIEKHVQKEVLKCNAGASNKEALRVTYTQAVQNELLMRDFMLHSEQYGKVTVAEVLDNPGRYHNTRFADPLEPDYRGDGRVAWANLHNAGRPYIYSHAHGGRRYTLHRATETVRLHAGELHNTITKVLELMRLDGSIFEHGGELVRIAGQEIVPVTTDWFIPYLTSLARFERFAGRNAGWVPADCPVQVAKSVLAMRGQWRLPKLRAVITAPIMRPDGSIIATQGYDPKTELFLQLNTHDGRIACPENPSIEAVYKAVDTLWRPFTEFPFEGPVDRGVFLAALLTAVERPILRTAPGVLLSAPAAGSGKTLLGKCISLLMGTPEPTLMPPASQEDELRKRLLAVTREGKPVILMDNVTGHLDSPSLCALMTSTQYSDRVLGQSVNLSFPVTALFIATGNNATLVGDLNRRILTCRINPQHERPHRRAFALDPEAYVKANRISLVTAALTILRGYQLHGTPAAADRTASFEEWSDLVRQAVLWVGSLGALDVADPMDSVDQTYSMDPETTKLAALIEGWHELFRDKPTTVAEAINEAQSLSTIEPYVTLRSAMDEIAGERGVLNSRRLGRWIERQRGRIVQGRCFEACGYRRGVAVWQVRVC